MRIKSLVITLLLGIFFCLNFFSAKKESLTYDEPVHLKAGVEEWQKRIFSLDTNNPPLIRELVALPVVLGINPGRQYLFPRMIVTLMGAILGYLVFRFSEKSFGFLVGIFALFFFVFEPDILTHSHYTTLDIGASLFFFIAFLTFKKFLNHSGWKNAAIWGMTCGLAFASKITLILPLLFYFLLMIFLKKKIYQKNFWKKIIFAGFLSVLIIWTAYFFTFAPIIAEREDPTRISARLINFAEEKNLPFLKNTILWLKTTPVPLGYFLATIKNGFVYNLGNYNRYFDFLPLILFFKLPLILTVFFGIGLIGLIDQIGKIKNNRDLLIPLFLMILIFSSTKTVPRVRYLLPVFPLLIIVAALGASVFWQKKWGKAFVLLGISFYIWQALSFFPHFISFNNGFFSSFSSRILLFVDSNYDWGQSLPDLADYVKKENISQLNFSYFGTDSPENYGLVAERPFGEKFEERCLLYLIKLKDKGEKINAISLSNWYYCGYWQKEEFREKNIKRIVGKSILIF